MMVETFNKEEAVRQSGLQPSEVVAPSFALHPG
jgi:hypothetical protein